MLTPESGDLSQPEETRPVQARPQPLGSPTDRRGPGDRPRLPPPQPTRPVSTPSRHQRRPRGCADNRPNRLAANRRSVRPSALASPNTHRRTQPRDRHRRGARPRHRARLGRRAEPGQLPPVPRHTSRSASPTEPKQRGRGRLPACGRHGPDGRRAGVLHPRWPNFAVSLERHPSGSTVSPHRQPCAHTSDQSHRLYDA